MPPAKESAKDNAAAEAEKAAAEKADDSDDAPKTRKPKVVAEGKRDGKRVRVLTDGVHVWKEVEGDDA